MAQNPERAEEYPLDGITVLLADDEERLRQVVVMMIEELGAKVIAVGSCEEAVRIYRDRPGEIDTVMLDLRMGGMGGDEAFREIVELDPDARVLLVSGVRPSHELIDELERHGGGFVEKPFDIEQLEGALSSMVRMGRQLGV